MTDDLKARIRAALDAELAEQTYTQSNREGHVGLVDGDVETDQLAAAVLDALDLTPEYGRGYDDRDGVRRHHARSDTLEETQSQGSTIRVDPIEVRYCTAWEPR